MILVVLGTQDKPFTRLLKALESQKKSGLIDDEIIVQSGTTQYSSDVMKCFDLIPIEEFDHLIETADLMITHGGVGSILGALKKHKKVIAVARLQEYGEHVNDHQKEILEQFEQMGYLLCCENFDDLHEMIHQIHQFVPKPYQSTTENVVNVIKNYILTH